MIWPRKGSREAGTLASRIPWGLRLWAMAGQLLAWLSSLPTAVVYGSLSLFVTILHNVFLLYYVDTFVSVYKIDKLAFWVGETVFLLWNSLNDPLFGWLSDRVFLSSPPRAGASIPSQDVVLTRLRALSRHGPLLALAFLAFWVQWAPTGMQFLLCLCLYDGFLTLVDLNHHALLADLALSAHSRTHLNFYCSLFSAAGSLSVFASYAVWNKEDFSSFRVFCVVLAVCSGLGFTGATWLLRQRFETEGRTLGALHSASESPDVEKPSANEEEKRVTLGEYLQQLARHRNFLWFVGMNLVQWSILSPCGLPLSAVLGLLVVGLPLPARPLVPSSLLWAFLLMVPLGFQVFHCHFNSNFFPLFLEHLLSDQISLSMGSFLLGVSYIAPHLNNLYFLALCQRWGVYAVVRGLFLLKLGLSLLMLLAGPDHLHLLCIFIASNRVFTEGTCKLLTLVVTDLVDEDLVLNRRKQAASALLFGMVALVTKPGQTFAPLLGTWLLCFYTGHDLFHQPLLTPVGSARPWLEPPAPPRAPALRQGCFYLLVLVPIMCALLQLITWSQFTLHGRRLHMIKAQRQSLSKPWNLDIKTV